MEAQETIHCRGHPLVLGNHPTTFEVTAEDHLTKNGNCIIGVAADKGCKGLSAEFRRVLCHDDAVLFTTCLRGGNCRGEIRGSSALPLTIRRIWSGEGVPLSAGGQSVFCPTMWRNLPEALIANLVLGKEMIVTLTATRPGERGNF